MLLHVPGYRADISPTVVLYMASYLQQRLELRKKKKKKQDN